MRKFETIVMSETEPVSQGTLWLRPKKNTLDKNNFSQFDIWFFGERGWRPIADFDTRYKFKQSYDETPSETALSIVSDINSEIGIVVNDLKFKVYKGLRDITNSSNFVLESGLKKEIDKLKTFIDNEISRLDGRINTLSSTIDNLSRVVESNTDRIAKVEGRLSLLES